MNDLEGKIAAGEPLMQQAMGALRRYHEARDSHKPAEEVERLRLEAESLFEAVHEYQRRALGRPAHPLH
ncbi:hypothetical protein [Pseudomonas alkylphenolica]|uniref:Uncharacterized protein n=1 Tax=Pseudomonas alkylphenolica TaxID=237609 RepID=A0A077FBF3_9PSED|nr:hypothetical protein [Pseudomonas alkylphenolica]AIL61129.1 hypothetical protein PSAKL28_19070 [Pseudomonas alkylphenolica]